MSLLFRSLLMNAGLKRINACNSVSNDLRLNCAQYYASLSKPADVSTNPKPNQDEEPDIAPKQSLKHQYSSIIEQAKYNFSKALQYMNVFQITKFNKHGALWYNTLDRLNVNEFFELLQLSDTFYSRHKIIELHVWIILYHLPRGTVRNNNIRNALISAMWSDTENRARLVHNLNKSFRKNLKSLNNKFKLTLFLYDLGVCESDIYLASTLWHCFYDKEDVDPRLLEALVHYVRAQIEHLSKFNLEDVEKVDDKYIWLPIKPFVMKAFLKS